MELTYKDTTCYGGSPFAAVCISVSVCNQDYSESYEWTFMKLVANDLHQNVFLEFNFEGIL